MPSKNSSRKNKTTHVSEKPMANDDELPTIVMKSKSSSRSSTLSNVSIKVISDWEKVGMTKEEFEEMNQRVAEQMKEWEAEKKQAFKRIPYVEMDEVDYWENQIEILETRRERYNKKRGWSAQDLDAIDEIDEAIAYCEEQLDELDV